MRGFDVFLIPVEGVGQWKGLGLQEIDFSRFVFVERPDVFFAGRWNGIFDKNNQKSILALVFNIRNPGARLQFPFFDKGEGQFFAMKIVIGIYQAIPDHMLIEFIS